MIIDGNVVGLYGDPSDPVEVAVHEGVLYRDENQIHPDTTFP
jgi:hypothetical protein